MIKTEILDHPLPPIPPDDTRRDDGAEVVFHGRVRAEEFGQAIAALDYEHYAGMAEKELRTLAEETVDRFGIHDLICQHRVGRIPVGEVALRVTIWSRHRAEAFSALDWFVLELKKRVPIWKWGVGVDGERYPSPPPGGPDQRADPSDPEGGNRPARGRG